MSNQPHYPHPAYKNEVYLGDGLYAFFIDDMIRLRAPRLEGDHEVYLEQEVLRELINFVKDHCPPHWKEELK